MRDLASAVADVRAGAKARDVRCPAHDDQRQSLSVTLGRNGWVLLHCHAGCHFEDVKRASGLADDAFRPPTSSRSTSARHIETTYDYRDSAGTLRYQVARFAPKDFRPRRPDGAGGWVWNLSGVDRLLYRLPDLKGHDEMLVVEGEKDVETLRALGYASTCNDGGAGKWRDSHTQQLVAAGVKRVVVIPDNDDAGRAHATRVVTSCRKAGLTATLVSLPDLSVKGDVTDYLQHHSKADLDALLRAGDTPARSAIVTFLDRVEPTSVSWTWPQRIAAGKFTLLAGEPGVGKTYLALDCAARISRGLPWPDGTPAPLGTVLYLTAEDGIADTLRPRLDRLGADPSRIAVLEAVQETDGTRRSLSLKRDLDVLGRAVEQVRPSLVIIDPITAYLGDTDAHRDAEVRGTLAPLVDLLEQHQCALIAIGHLTKDQQKAALHRPGGSIAFVAAARLVFAVAADPQNLDRRLVVPLKANLCRPASALAYRVTEDRLVWEADPVANVDVDALFRPTLPQEREEQTDAESVIRELLQDEDAWPLDARQAIETGQAHGIHERTMRRTAKRMGIRVERDGFGRGGRWRWQRPIADSIPDSAPRTHTVSSMAAMQKDSSIADNNNIEDTKTSFTRAREDEEASDGDQF